MKPQHAIAALTAQLEYYASLTDLPGFWHYELHSAQEDVSEIPQLWAIYNRYAGRLESWLAPEVSKGLKMAVEAKPDDPEVSRLQGLFFLYQLPNSTSVERLRRLHEIFQGALDVLILAENLGLNEKPMPSSMQVVLNAHVLPSKRTRSGFTVKSNRPQHNVRRPAGPRPADVAREELLQRTRQQRVS